MLQRQTDPLDEFFRFIDIVGGHRFQKDHQTAHGIRLAVMMTQIDRQIFANGIELVIIKLRIEQDP